MIKKYIWFAIIFLGIIFSLINIFEGIKKNKLAKSSFKLKHLFEKKTFSEKSGTQLIIEGMILISVIFVWFILAWCYYTGRIN